MSTKCGKRMEDAEAWGKTPSSIIGKNCPIDWQGCAGLQGLPVFAAVFASLQQSCIASASVISIMVDAIGQCGLGNAKLAYPWRGSAMESQMNRSVRIRRMCEI